MAQDSVFLDSVTEMLQRLALVCEDAFEWSSDSEKTLAHATEALSGIILACRDAGIAVSDASYLDDVVLQIDEAQCPAELRDGVSLSTRASDCASSSVDACVISAASVTSAASWLSLQESQYDADVDPEESESEDESSVVVTLVQEEDGVPIKTETTNHCAHTHGGIRTGRAELAEQLCQAEMRCSESHSHTQRELMALQHALESSRARMEHMQQELLSTQQSVAALEAAVTESRQSVEAAMKEQARQWKAICSELVIEKRNVVQKLAEERGKCAALREHLVMHAGKRDGVPQRSKEANEVAPR